MSNIIVLGAQWGDEGKGKVVDLFCERFDDRGALPGRAQRGPHGLHRRAQVYSEADPQRDSAAGHRWPSSATAWSSTRRRCWPRSTRWSGRHRRGRAVVHQQSRARDLPVPPHGGEVSRRRVRTASPSAPLRAASAPATKTRSRRRGIRMADLLDQGSLPGRCTTRWPRTNTPSRTRFGIARGLRLRRHPARSIASWPSASARWSATPPSC